MSVVIVGSCVLFAHFSPITGDEVLRYVDTKANGVVSFCMAILPYGIMHICTLSHMANMLPIMFSRSTFELLSAHFKWPIITLCWTWLYTQRIPEAVHCWASPVSIRKSVVKYSSGSPTGYWGWCEAFRLVENLSFSDCWARNAGTVQIVLGIRSSPIVMISVVVKRMSYDPRFRVAILKPIEWPVSWRFSC